MNKNRLSRQELWAPISSDVRGLRKRSLSLRAWIGALLIIWCLSGISPDARADCFDLCQGNLAGCLANANGNPTAEFACQKAYDNCGQQCLLD